MFVVVQQNAARHIKETTMSIYLIDYENTKNLVGINNLSSADKVIIFYSKKANTLSFDSHKDIMNSKAQIEYKFVDVGAQNALDFQLGSYLGYLIRQNENTEVSYNIVSKDKGFAYVASFWQNERNITIKLCADLTGKAPNSEKAEKTAVNDPIQGLLKQSNLQLSDKDIKTIAEMVSKYKTTTTINSNLNKLLKDSAKAGEILKIIKPFIKK